MTRDDITNQLFQTLKQALQNEGQNRGVTQVGGLVDSIRALIPRDTPEFMHWQYHQIALEIIHEWYRAGVLFFGKPNDPHEGLPWITITTFGRECIESGNLLPYDPESYIRELKQKVPMIDALSIQYLSEAISTYNTEHLLSSTVMLGVASENMILLLVEAFCNAITDPQEKQSFMRQIDNKGIYKKYEHFKTQLQTHIRQLPLDLSRDLDAQLDSVFHFVRISRNQIGHPTGQAPTKKVVGSNLQIIAEYSKRIFDLVEFFGSNQI